MNLQELDILKELSKHSYIDKVILAEISEYSLEEVEDSLKELIRKGYMNKDHTLTELGIEELEKKNPKNAIILAAGLGTRMVPINSEIPKGLLEVRGEILIERLINQLQEVGVKEINIVVGFMAEKFEYLKEKYGVNLIFNEDYALNDSLHSLNLAKDKLGNSYILPSDIYCENNPFSKRELYSWYMVSEEIDKKSIFKVNEKDELALASPEEEGNSMIGIAYILEKKAKDLKKNLKKMALYPSYMDQTWDEVLVKNRKILVSSRMESPSTITTINTYEELREIDPDSPNLESEIIYFITKTFNADPEEITNIVPFQEGMTNHTFKFKFKNKEYMVRIPGEGTDKLVNRNQEYEVYQELMDLNISDKVLYFNPDNGFRITEFWEDARVCDPRNLEDVKSCINKLKELHELEIKVDHEFDLFEKIEYYESLREGQTSIHPDYEEIKEKVYELKKYIDSLSKKSVLSHIDSVPNNLLLIGDKVRIIDWEYAGMHDPHIDIAMFAVSSGYNKIELDSLIEIYFPEGCEQETKTKIYAYVALCGFLWSNWSEYKTYLGVELGDYVFAQYAYAKKFYQIAKEAMEGKVGNKEEKHIYTTSNLLED